MDVQEHSIYLGQLTLSARFKNCIFGQNNMHRTIDFCPDQITCCKKQHYLGNKERLKALNDTKLVLNELK